MRGLVVLALALALSGCVAPTLSPDLVPATAPSSGGYGGSMWTVHVVDMEGQPVEGAAVVAYWPGTVPGNSPQARREALAGTRAEFTFGPVNVTLHYVALRTDARGMVHVEAPPSYPVSFVAQAANTTQEWSLAADRGAVQPVQLRLYPQVLRMDWNRTFLGGEQAGATCRLDEIPLDDALKMRLTSINATLTWSNGVPQGVADWEVGFQLRPAITFPVEPFCPPAHGDVGAHLGLGPQQESLSLETSRLGLRPDRFFPNEAIYIGPVNRGIGAIRDGMVATPLMQYHLHVDLHLDAWRQTLANHRGEYSAFTAMPAPEDGGRDPAGLWGDSTLRGGVSLGVPAASLAFVLLSLLVFGVVRRR